MSDTAKQNDGGPAYPIEREKHDMFGLTKREWFAGMAMQGLSKGYFDNDVIADEIARAAYIIADAMIEVGEEVAPQV